MSIGIGTGIELEGAYESCPAGYVVTKPRKTELFVDIDNKADREHLVEMLNVLRGFKGYNEATITRDVESRQPDHRHITVDVGRRLRPMERLLLQAVLGSDRKRELLGYMRLQLFKKQPTSVFYEKE